MKLFIKKLFDKLIKYLSYILPILLFSILSFIFAKISNRQIEIYVLISVMLIIIFLCIILFAYDFYKDYKRIMMSEVIPTDVELKNYNVVVTFDDNTLINRNTMTTIYRKILNRMIDSNTTYGNYMIRMSSLTDAPHSSESIKVKLDNDYLPLTSFDPDAVNFTKLCEIEDSELDFPLERQIVRFNVPINLQAGETTEFFIRYTSEAYRDSLDGKVDFVTLETVRITNEIKCEILLKGKFIDKYEITHATKEDGTEILSFNVMDSSFQRMKNTEHEMLQNGNIPKYNAKKAFWIIHKPKIGYKYRIYFKLIPKE